ncbi:alpha/beta hydrolase [Adhaeribacter aquaticus]|uniref:alpha/beta hydrolase n=1 Tax=Adhaeribacter aquaticus TaxID=299567 RepID=UPI000425DBBD|nr:alpha/beta hydrolase [Adhaeribacter aquaticus]
MLIRTPTIFLANLLAGCFLVFNISGCAFTRINRSKDITYLDAKEAHPVERQQLDVYAPYNTKELKDVFVFIHGGNWNSGNKTQYSFLGARMARKGVVTVIINYPLSPKATYREMAAASAKAAVWVKQHIQAYGGNPERIFISGHSAGGHLAALISIRDEYFNQIGIQNPIKGTILIDAAGLDMYGYLQEQNYASGNTYLDTFTTDPATWKEASPLYHLHPQVPPFLIYLGEKTYPSISKSNEKFVKALKTTAPYFDYRILEGKKHIPMITQFIFSWNPRYNEIRQFMQDRK